jgi:PAS domain S-box-containing protein
MIAAAATPREVLPMKSDESRKTPPEPLASDLERADRARRRAQEAREQFARTQADVQETWRRLMTTRDRFQTDREMRLATLNLLEDAEHALRGQEEQAAGRAQAEKERATAEAQLHESDARFRAMADAAPALIWEMDATGVLFVNQHYLDFFGVSFEQVRGMGWAHLLHPDDAAEYLAALLAAYGERRAHTADVRVRRADGEWRWLRNTGRAVGERRFVGCSIDLTELRESQESLRQSQADTWAALQEAERARAEAVAAGQAKDHFLATLSHELRTPLTPVMLGVQICRDETGLPPIVEDALEMIERNVAAELRLIDDLLDMTRIERGKLELHCARTDLHEVARRAVEITRCEVEARTQRLDVQLAAAQHECAADAARLQQVFWNLLRNACKFTPPRGCITLASRNDAPDRITFTVTDTGIGLTPAQLERIFEAFTQATIETAREYGGLGLGLAIARGVIAAHGGSIRAESLGPGCGATFVVELPLL